MIYQVFVTVALLAVAHGRIISCHDDRNATVGEENHFPRLRMRGGDVSTSKDTFCTTPVSKGAVVFPDSIAGRAKINFDMYSGYVPVSSADYLFYWFFETQDKNPDAPLLIWTNGGPGCTAMEGATTEHGPLSLFDIKESCSNAGSSSKCDYTGQLSANAFAWNKNANVLYLDQPKNVGFSFGTGPETKSSVEAADDFLVFYLNWVKLFPEFVNRKLIIGGESYGGHYIPAWTNALMNYNDKQSAENQINLSGVVIGNGCINNTVQDLNTYVQFQHENNLIPSTSTPKTQSAAKSAMVSYLGYDPNYYDYRIQSVTCSACYSYNYTAWSYWFLQKDVLTALNVCGDAGNDAFSGSAGGCISMGAFDSRDNFDYSAALARALNKNIPVTLFYGKTDTACNYVGGLAVANTLEWNSKAAFASQPMSDFELGFGVSAGQIKSVNGLTFIQIEDAGHMVPMDQPAASAAVFNHLLAQIQKK